MAFVRSTPIAPPNSHGRRKFLRAKDRIAIMKTIFIGAAVAALIATPALAADMAVKAPAAQAYSWKGSTSAATSGGSGSRA